MNFDPLNTQLMFSHIVFWKITPRKFIYSEKAKQFCEIFTLLLSYLVPVKSKVEISQNCLAFSEYMNFNKTVHCYSYMMAVFTVIFHLPGTALAQGPFFPRGKTCPWSKREISILLCILIKLKIFSVSSHPQKK